MTNLQANSDRDLLYSLIIQNIGMYIKAPGTQDIRPLIVTLSDAFTKLVEIDDTPKGKELKQKIIELLVPDEHLFPVLQSLAEVDNNQELADYVGKAWFSNEWPAYRIEAVKFLFTYTQDSVSMVKLLFSEKDTTVRLQIVEELAKHADGRVYVFNVVAGLFNKEEESSEIQLMAVTYLKNIATKSAVELLLSINENPDLSLSVRNAAYEAQKQILLDKFKE